MSECELFWAGGTLFCKGGGEWGVWGIILGGWGWVGKNFGWVGVGGDTWGLVEVGALFDNALYLNLSVSNFYITTFVNNIFQPKTCLMNFVSLST